MFILHKRSMGQERKNLDSWTIQSSCEASERTAKHTTAPPKSNRFAAPHPPLTFDRHPAWHRTGTGERASWTSSWDQGALTTKPGQCLESSDAAKYLCTPRFSLSCTSFGQFVVFLAAAGTVWKIVISRVQQVQRCNKEGFHLILSSHTLYVPVEL